MDVGMKFSHAPLQHSWRQSVPCTDCKQFSCSKEDCCSWLHFEDYTRRIQGPPYPCRLYQSKRCSSHSHHRPPVKRLLEQEYLWTHQQGWLSRFLARLCHCEILLRRQPMIHCRRHECLRYVTPCYQTSGRNLYPCKQLEHFQSA